MDVSQTQNIENVAQEDRGEEQIILVFSLGKEEFALNVNEVKEIVRVPPVITRVPNAPDYIRGVINLRGTIVPVFDMELKLGMEEKALTEDSRIVVVSWNDIQFGILVDSVREVCTVFDSQIEQNIQLDTSMEKKYLLGVIKQEGGRLVVLLDLVTLFDLDVILADELDSEIAG
ncbi:MAG: chemotaxis protein CheW [Aminobacterium sp.]|jgi:purine-binding chemotaxis protein CheW|uniref:CheW-like domain-containing protein n=1 Tax=bioreactor metagenome TaxID=1076179 RepID=A0A645C0D7_9ZZZZ|nr:MULTISPECIES: chemotaxis protein CheW [unclassified Aminobacterium]MDD2207519.1 chemotaxis protein CheW [Aminobacterium sp.]MDD3426360.1 chemotaxis protein CheW [Aminobacterium sp.]MDD3707508.1 chemotaxis protein CheW [Aminobacterium sp.]MDD4229373.1 chemotaxis protein CheW [Aminobacterium sp.]MDD4552347.1 chemotaxis protein CheW [Aminobacterium sp.]